VGVSWSAGGEALLSCVALSAAAPVVVPVAEGALVVDAVVVGVADVVDVATAFVAALVRGVATGEVVGEATIGVGVFFEPGALVSVPGEDCGSDLGAPVGWEFGAAVAALPSTGHVATSYGGRPVAHSMTELC
jgi:hypothetical protein